MHRSSRTRLAVLWVILGSIAAGVCSLLWPAAHIDSRFAHVGVEPEYLPVGIDSFYHARRILDTAVEPESFYEFDPRIHAPEGSLLNWPWGYDYAMGWLVRLGTAAGIAPSPIAFLIWIPVAMVFASVGLVMLIAQRLSLSLWSTIIAALCVAFSPLTQILHGVGMIDHHFAEYLLVLATISLGLKWFLEPQNERAAAAVGLVIGIAPAIHNGLFVLQIPILLTLLALWLQDVRLPKRSALFFCFALLSATIGILIPSQPARLGRFEFYTLSWFHLYVACGTAIVAVLFAWLARTRRNIGLLLLIGAVLLGPLARQIMVAHAFLAGTIERLDAILEMQSPARMSLFPGGIWNVSKLYSFLIWLLPFSAAYCLSRGWRERNSGRLFFWICLICGLSLLVLQFRLHYFGSLALYLPWLVLIDRLAVKWPTRRKQVMLMASLAFLVMYSAPMRYQLTTLGQAPAGDPNFISLRPILGKLQKACAEDPGIVLADNDAGHYIRYYTSCSVIANNFLLTRQHEEKINQIDYLTSLSANALPEAAPYVRYVLLRPASIARLDDKQFQYMSYSPKSGQLITDLLLHPASEAPKDYALLEQASMRSSVAETGIPYIRLYKITTRRGR